MLSGDQYIYYRLESADALIRNPLHEVRELDWYGDLAMIQRFYSHWTKDTIDPGKNDETVGNPLAIVVEDEIVSFAVPFSFRDGELEIGAVATVPAWQNKGYCKALIAELAFRILKSERAATLTTRRENLPMQAAALAIGMLPVNNH